MRVHPPDPPEMSIWEAVPLSAEWNASSRSPGWAAPRDTCAESTPLIVAVATDRTTATTLDHPRIPRAEPGQKEEEGGVTGRRGTTRRRRPRRRRTPRCTPACCRRGEG